MKVGDKVKVIGLTEIDKEHTNLEIGHIGTVTSISPYNDGITNIENHVYDVDFGNNFACSYESENYNEDTNEYAMYGDQIELVEDDAT